MCVCVFVCSRLGREVGVYSLVVVQMTVYLTGYSNCLTGFREPLSLPYRCYTALKKKKQKKSNVITVNFAQCPAQLFKRLRLCLKTEDMISVTDQLQGSQFF